jgi:hypothetical protein
VVNKKFLIPLFVLDPLWLAANVPSFTFFIMP